MRLGDVRASIALVCAAALLAPAAPAQEPGEQKYKLLIVRGENAQNNIKKGRATRPVVEVRDRNNNPVAGVAVTFLLPNSGPSGTFVGGAQSTTVTTNAAGQASASFSPNTVPGQYNINVSANVNGQSLTAQISTVNVVTGAVVTATTLAVILGIAAAAGVGLGIGLTRGGGSTAPTGITIGPGTGTVTPPR